MRNLTRLGILLLVWMFPAPRLWARQEPELKEFLASPFRMALTAYQRFLSPSKGTSCPMEPSDSSYARQAIETRGLFRGLLMTADRLHRCGHDASAYPRVSTARGIKLYDPVDSDPQNP